MIVGHRCKPHRDGKCRLGMGDYGKNENGVWWARLPESGNLVSLLDPATKVMEHSDGTISVSGPLTTYVMNDDNTRSRVEWKLDRGRWEKTERRL